MGTSYLGQHQADESREFPLPAASIWRSYAVHAEGQTAGLYVKARSVCVALGVCP